MMNKETSLEQLKQRYPDLAFLLSFFPHEKVALENDPSKLNEWLQQVDLNQIEVIYLIGLVDFDLPPKLYDWLHAKKQHALIFIEDDLGAIAAFANDSHWNNPQIHLHYASEDPIEFLARQFPTEWVAIYEGKPFDAERLKRRSFAYSALYSDVLYSHKIVENVIKNTHHFDGAFDARGSFKDVPAIICGAGPSLEKTLPYLKQCKQLALIFAGGTAISAKGVNPHFAIALDPNDEEFDRLKQSTYFEGPFLFAPRLHQNVFSTVNGPFGYMKTDTGGLIEGWLEQELGLPGGPIGPDLGDEAFSVTTLAISHAFALGCNPIILVGVDLAYTGGKRYMEGIGAEGEKEEILLRKDIYGNAIATQLRWVMESECIASFAKKHPERQFFNATEGGIGFEGIENRRLDQILENGVERDLEGEIHQWIQSHPLQWKKEKFPKLLADLSSSLQRSKKLTHEILAELSKKKETGRLTLFESDLAEELAYSALLEGIAIALDHLLIRYYPNLDPNLAKWERKEAKYKELMRQIQKFSWIGACI